MPTLPEREQQIEIAHAGLIRQIIMAAQNRDQQAGLEPILRTSEQNGWTALVSAIRKILAGQRDEELLRDLDEEDRVIIQAILQGLQAPESLPHMNRSADPTMAAPGLAVMINEASRGNLEALQILGHMAEQMNQVGGDMTRLGGALRRMMNGERNPEALCKGMGHQGQQLVLSVLLELGKRNTH